MKIKTIFFCLIAILAISCQKEEKRNNPFEGRTFYCQEDDVLSIAFKKDGTAEVWRYYSILNGEEYPDLFQVIRSEVWHWSYEDGNLSIIPAKWQTFGYKPFDSEIFWTDCRWENNYIVFDCYFQDSIGHDLGIINREATYHFQWR